VLADVAQLTRLPDLVGRRLSMSTRAEDVEDWAVAVITFEDGTKATVHSNDITLGGVRNVVTAYLTNGVVHANINPNTTVAAYAPDGAVWGDEYITEKVETKAGWQFPSPDEDWMRGYPQELADFVDAIRERREPLSGARLARDVVEVIFARDLWDHRHAKTATFTVETKGGVVECQCHVRDGRVNFVTVEMGHATFRAPEIPMSGPDREVVGVPLQLSDGTTLSVTAVSVGNPHCVTFVNRLDDAEGRRLGPLIE